MSNSDAWGGRSASAWDGRNGCRWLLLLTLVSLSGCNGCRPDTDKLTREELEKRAREQRESLEMSELLSLPTDSGNKILAAKPGHWYETQQQFKSNREDLQVVAVGTVTRGAALAKVPGTDVVNEFTRRTSLPKGQTKTVDLQYFVPFSGQKEDPYSTVSNRLSFRTELLSWPLMSPILQSPSVKPANELKAHEFQLVVLSPEALSYDYLTVLDAVYWRGDGLQMDYDRTRSYYVSLVAPSNNRYAFPRSMLTMTASAVIVWDDVSTEDLSVDQQNALIDWVHWGGQLVISGPSSWSRLQNSFLSKYLPATSADATEFSTESFADISRTWIVPDRSAPGSREPLEIVGPPVGGLKLKLGERGQWLPGTGQMVAESQVGRGRIVVTSFPMREPRIFRWKYFSSFFSTGLLRRHPRRITKDKVNQFVTQDWARPFEGSQHDARLHSNVRILSRDLPLSNSAVRSVGEENLEQIGTSTAGARSELGLNAPEVGSRNSLEAMLWGGGGAAWNDYSGLSFQALAALKAAAGIELPSRKTIVYLLAGYLLCLVPANWLLFRLIGRLEFAWIAAPIMALLGVVVVTKVARLDIGFARRTTEISVLEFQGEHPRGHLTQYLALYTSLSTNYAVDFPENGSVALPLGDVSRIRQRAGAKSQNLRTNYGRSEGVKLEPLTVYSNSTEMLHSEQMVSFPGGLDLEQPVDAQPEIRNETGLQLQGVLLIRRLAADTIETAWVGELATGQAAALDYQAVSDGSLWEHWAGEETTQPTLPNQNEKDSESETTATLWIGGVLAEVVRKTPLLPGQVRLFGYTDDRPGDLEVTPAEDQFDGRCVIVAHLKPQELGNVQPDLSIMSRIPAGTEGLSEGDKELDELQPVTP